MILPTPPLRSDGPAVFADRGDAFMAALPAFETRMEAIDTNVTALESAVAAAAPGAVAAANFKGEYAAGTTYQVGHSASYGDDTWFAKTINTGVTPVVGANWQRVVAIPSQAGSAGKVLGTDGSTPAWVPSSSVGESQRPSNTQLSEADRSTIISASGTFTQTFDAATTLGSGWFCYIKNSGTGVITLDPNGSETIDGLTSFAMYPKETRLIQCNGSVFTSVVLTKFVLEPTSSMSFIEPPGYRAYEVFLIGSGGGGGSGRTGATLTSRYGGGGGGGGSTAWGIVRASTPGASIAVTYGSNGNGGAAVSATSTDGNLGTNGGTHLFGAHLSAKGGQRGTGGTSTAAGAAGVNLGPSTAMVLFTGGSGGDGGIASAGKADWAATGGSGGALLNSSNVAASGLQAGYSGTTDANTQIIGGVGGNTSGARDGGSGNVGASHRGGTGGGGGASHATLAGGAGGNGLDGGGGGGGGGALNGVASGAGGSSTGRYYIGGI